MEKPTQCPQCKEISLWHNLKLSPKTNEPYENHNCKCGYIKWEDKKTAKEHYDSLNGIAPQAFKSPQTQENVKEVDNTQLDRMELKIDAIMDTLRNELPKE